MKAALQNKAKPLSSAAPLFPERLHTSGQPSDAEPLAVTQPRFGHNFSRMRVHRDATAAKSAAALDASTDTVGTDVVFGTGRYASHTPADKRLLAHKLTREVGSRTNTGQRTDHPGPRIPWSWPGAGIGALGGAVGGAIIGGLIGGLPGALIGAAIGAVVGAVAGGLSGGAAAGARVVPTAIGSTQVDRATPGLGPTYYGSVFKHTLTTSGGTITPDVTVAELVRVTRDDFATGFTGVPLGTLTWGPGGTAPLSGNDMFDNIGTNNINVTNFLPSPPNPGLPAIMETPQELHYRIGTGSWTKFADVPMVVTLRARVGGGFEVETRNNNIPSVQNYTGPT